MARSSDNPDCNFSTDGDPEGFDGLRRWLAESKPDLPYNEAARFRIGKAIGDAVLRSCRPLRRLGAKRAGPI
jgi:hypothetical protein